MIILIAESNYSPEAVKVYKTLGEVYFWFPGSRSSDGDKVAKSVSELSQPDRDRFLSKIDIIVIRLMLNVRKELIDRMSNLKIIATSTTGLNHIDVDYAEKRGVKVISLRGETLFLRNIPSTAEETWGLLLALVRNLPWAFDDVKNGNWTPNKWVGHQLMGKTIGLLGLGRLGKIVAEYAVAFKMNVISYDPAVSQKEMKKYGAKKVAMDYLFKNSDIVSLHVLLNDETYGLVKDDHLKMMKPTAYLINTARGELIEKGGLESALEKKWIAGAAIDVMWDEKDDSGHLKDNKLMEYAKKNTNLIIVPHIGGTTYDATRITQDFIAELVRKNCKKSG